MYAEAASQPQQGSDALQPEVALPLERSSGRWVGRVLWLEAAVLLAVVQVLFAGYRMGVGNQTIQIPFLKQWANPSLYANDPMVAGTLRDYPSFFFRGLALLTRFADVPLLYFILHLVTSFAVLMGTYWLGRTIFKDRLAGFISALRVVSGPHRALSGGRAGLGGGSRTLVGFSPAGH